MVPFIVLLLTIFALLICGRTQNSVFVWRDEKLPSPPQKKIEIKKLREITCITSSLTQPCENPWDAHARLLFCFTLARKKKYNNRQDLAPTQTLDTKNKIF